MGDPQNPRKCSEPAAIIPGAIRNFRAFSNISKKHVFFQKQNSSKKMFCLNILKFVDLLEYFSDRKLKKVFTVMGIWFMIFFQQKYSNILSKIEINCIN